MSISPGIDLGVLQRLGAGRSIEAFQENLLEELRSVLLLDRTILITSGPELLCPSGLWHSKDIPCKTWKMWCDRVSKTELMRAGLLFMLNLKHRSAGDVQAISSLGVLLLRRDRPFDPPEIETLIPIHQALQILLEQSIALDRLLNKNAEAKTIANPGSANSRSIHSEQQPGPIDYALDQSGVMESVSDPLYLGLGLTPRQCEVIHLLMRGNGTRTIAQSIGCSEATVRKHLENLYRRLGVQNRTAAIAHILGKIGIV